MLLVDVWVHLDPSINPNTNEAYGLSFPVITIKDIVKAQESLLDHFKIKKLLCATGGSMGGMQALQFCTLFPERIIFSNTHCLQCKS